MGIMHGHMTVYGYTAYMYPCIQCGDDGVRGEEHGGMDGGMQGGYQQGPGDGQWNRGGKAATMRSMRGFVPLHTHPYSHSFTDVHPCPPYTTIRHTQRPYPPCRTPRHFLCTPVSIRRNSSTCCTNNDNNNSIRHNPSTCCNVHPS